MFQKQVFPFLLVLFFNQFCKAQELNELIKDKKNLSEISAIASTYFKNKPSLFPKGKYVDNEYIQFKRKEYYWQHRVNEDGSLPNIQARFEIYKSLRNQPLNKKTRGNTWRNISQTNSVSGYDGMGRLLTIAFHPTDTNTFYVGASIGGIWKTSNGGNSWTPLGDELPYCSVGNIVVDFQNPSTIYLTVGQNQGWWEYGLGIYKSTDGGQNWIATSQISNYTDVVVYYKLMMAPNDHSTLYSAQSNGFWKSTDAGTTWTKILTGSFIDFEFKPNNPNTIYLSKRENGSEVFKTTDAGLTWNPITSLGISNNNIEIAVTPIDSNYIGLGTNGGGVKNFYLSTDGGNNFVLKNSNIDDNAVVHFSNTNKNKIYCGYVSNYRSTNGGSSWTQITNWYNDGVLPPVHADNQFALANPLQPKYIYYCNDGGLYRYNETNNTWKDLSNGLIITQFYKIANSQQDSVFMIGGTQDNGGRKRIASSSWDATNGGDGMEVAINNTNDQTIYTTYVNGQLYRSYDQWTNDTYYDITADINGGSWVTPYLLDYNNQFRIVAGYKNVWLSNDEGDNWTQISNNITGNTTANLTVLDIARTNSNVIYTGRANKIYYTNNLGANWSTKTIPGVSSFFTEVSQVLVHPKNENVIYITKTGYSINNKIYKSTDNGSTWKNITYNIPNIPVNCITIDIETDSSNVDMYIGTDVGVFYKKELDTVWQYYGTGMPNTEVADLEIYYPTRKLRAGTHGRGIFEIDLNPLTFPASNPSIKQAKNEISLMTNPVSNVISILINSSEEQAFTFSILDESGKIIKKETARMIAGNNVKTITLEGFANGIYFVDIRTAKNWSKTLKFLKQ